MNLATTNYRLENAFRFINDVISSNNYYFFVGDYLPQSNSSIPPLYDNTSNTLTSVYTNMIMGKQIVAADVYPVISNIQWAANTIYNMYNDADPNLSNEDFFVITN